MSATVPENPADTPFFQLGVLIPFVVCALLWGGTWIVIKDQLAVVPPAWSVTYRFMVAAAAMFALVALRRLPLRLSGRGQLWAMALGISQFMLNFNFVYAAELYVTSGLVAVMFALLIIPNALLGWLLLGQRISPLFFAGSALAILGVAALFIHEFRSAGGATSGLWLGIVFTLLGVLSASAAAIMQGTQAIKQWPILSLLAWAMLWGALGNALFAFVSSGPPVIDPRLSYWAGIAYLSLAASVVTFPLYFNLVRKVGTGRAAYVSTIVPITAMVLSTLFEDYRWTLLAGTGGVLAFVGLVIAMQARRRKLV